MNILYCLAFFQLILKYVFATSQLIAKEWGSPPYTGWGNGATVLCAGQLIEANKQALLLSSANSVVSKTYTGLPDHYRILIRVDYVIIDDWGGNSITFKVDSSTVKSYTYYNEDNRDLDLNICGDRDILDRFERAEFVLSHTSSSLTFQVQVSGSPKAAMTDLQIYIDTCHINCKTCTGSNENQCSTCKTGASITSGQCKCPVGKYMWQGLCQDDCTGNLKKSVSGYYCEEILCKKANCSTCDTDNNSCSKCIGRYKIYKGDCITTCPSYTTNVAGVCQDSISKYWNGYYLFQGFFEDDFNNFTFDSYGFTMNQKHPSYSPIQDTNWASFSDCQDQTGWRRFFGGFGIYGQSVSISKTFNIVDQNNQLIKHSSVLIKFYYAQIENYETLKSTGAAEYVGVFINGVKSQQLVGGGTDMGCGRLDQGENFGWIEANSTSTNITNKVILEIKNNFEDPAWYEGFGLREMVIIVSKCIDNCDECGDYDGCVKCSTGYYLWRAQCYKDKCPDGSYQLTASIKKVCGDCHPTCLTCNGPNSNECLTCQDPRLFKSSECLLDCGIGFYPDKPSCKKCHAECYGCVGPTNNQCTKCTGNRYFYKLTSSCGLTCPDTFFANSSTNSCDPCNSKCLTCEGPSENQCLTCPSLRFLWSKKCEILCPAGMYGEKSNQTCQNCVNPCQTCKNTANTCTSCTIGLFLDGTQCNPSCPDRYFGNLASQVCEKCHTQCAKCKGANSDNCLSCDDEDGYFDSTTNKCVGQCPSKYFPTKENNEPICKLCYNTCTECKAPGDKNSCTRCSNGRYLTYNNECEKECPDYYFKDTSNYICKNCHTSCLSCINDSSTGCLSCEKKKFLNQGMCLTRCPAGTYADEVKSICVPCHPSCGGCDGDLYNSCTSCQLGKYLQNKTCSEKCKDGYYPDPSTNICYMCNAKCNTCTDASENSCLSCKSSLYLSNNACLSQCPDGQFHNNQTNNCEQCPYTCKTCLGMTTDECLSCSGNRYLVKPGLKCESYCPQGFFANTKTNECDECDWSCKNCFGVGSKQCNECLAGTFLYQNECVSLCPVGYFPTEQPNLCNACHFSCKTCTGSLENQCVSCEGDRYFLPHICMTECPDNYFGEKATNTCQKCDKSCLECDGINNNQCTLCYDDKYLLNHSCVDSCPDGYVVSLDKSKCLLCGSTCATCSSGHVEQCLSCLNDWYMHANKCYQICPEGTYESSKTEENINGIVHEIKICKNCIENCLLCTGPSDIQCTKWVEVAEKKAENKLLFYIFIGKSAFCTFSFFLGFYLDYLKEKPKKQKEEEEPKPNLNIDGSPEQKALKMQHLDDENQSPILNRQKNSSYILPSHTQLNIEQTTFSKNLLDESKLFGGSSPGTRRKQSQRHSTVNNVKLNLRESIKKQSQDDGLRNSTVLNQQGSPSIVDVTNVEISPLQRRNTRSNTNKLYESQNNSFALSYNNTERSPVKKPTFAKLKGVYDPITNTFNQFPDEDQRKYLPDKSFFLFFIIFFEITSLIFYYNKNLIRPIRVLSYYCKLLFLFWITSKPLQLVYPSILACVVGLQIIYVSAEKIVFILASTIQKTIAIIFTVLILLILYNVVWFLTPEIKAISYKVDFEWSVQYLIAFGFDLVLIQIIYMCFQYCYTLKYLFRDIAKESKFVKILNQFLFKDKFAVWMKQKDDSQPEQK